MSHDARPNSFRADVLSGGQRPSPLVTEKTRRLDPGAHGLDGVGMLRSERRHGNHRSADRHRLNGETAQVRYRRRKHVVDLINISGGGAMIRADFTPRLWSLLELRLGDGPAIRCAVRWIRDDRIGLEFVQETCIECDPEQRDALLLAVIRRSFPDFAESLAGAEAPAGAAGSDRRAETRYPLVWRGVLHSSQDSQPVRLRNISSSGALVEVVVPCEQGAEVALDLGGAGQQPATISWVHGDHVGLRFEEPFDLESLAETQPELAPQSPHSSHAGGSTANDSPWGGQ